MQLEPSADRMGRGVLVNDLPSAPNPPVASGASHPGLRCSMVLFHSGETPKPVCKSQVAADGKAEVLYLCLEGVREVRQARSHVRRQAPTSPGLPSILHPWGDTFRVTPPPLHGARRWPRRGTHNRAARQNHLLWPLQALSPISRVLFQEDRQQAGQLEHIDQQVWNIP